MVAYSFSRNVSNTPKEASRALCSMYTFDFIETVNRLNYVCLGIHLDVNIVLAAKTKLLT